jgi:hypothetical protein
MIAADSPERERDAARVEMEKRFLLDGIDIRGDNKPPIDRLKDSVSHPPGPAETVLPLRDKAMHGAERAAYFAGRMRLEESSRDCERF